MSEILTAEQLAELASLIATREPWLDRKGLAAHYSCSVRSIELAMDDGLPHAIVFGRAKFRVSEVDPWLRERGYLRRPDGASSVAPLTSEAATAPTAPPHDREVSPDGKQA